MMDSLIDQEHLAWMGVGIGIGGAISTVIWFAYHYINTRVERETREWLEHHAERGEVYDR